MIDAIINFFTDNHIGLGISKFLMRFVNFKRLLKNAKEITDGDTIEHINTQFHASLSEKQRSKLQGSIVLLLVQSANSDKWEVTALDSEYKFMEKVTIMISLASLYDTDLYCIRLQ